MPRNEQQPPRKKAVDDLAELVARERAKLRWRVKTRVPDEPRGSRGATGGTGKLYQVFQACGAE